MNSMEEPKHHCSECEHYEEDKYNKPIFYCRYWKTTFGTINTCDEFKLRRDEYES